MHRMSSDFPISRRLGDNYDATVRVSGAADRENEVYPQLDEVLELDLSELDAEAQQRLITLVERSVDKVCTVGRTLKAGTKVTLSFDTEADVPRRQRCRCDRTGFRCGAECSGAGLGPGRPLGR